MKNAFIIFFLIIGSIILRAQNISVTSFSPLPNDLTANTAGTEVKDQNGEKAALIRIQTTQIGFSFDAGMMGIVKTVQKTGEIWVYIPKGSKHITLRHQQLGTREYTYPCAIEAARTYEMRLTTGSVQTVIKKDIGGNFMALKVIPENASVYVDERIQPNDANGEYSIFLDYGEHSYRIEAAGYTSQTEIVNITKEPFYLNVILESNLATLSINCPTDGANIFLNKQSKGINDWKGNVSAGKYLIEASKEGYRSVFENIEISEKENKTITLPALQPIYGTLKVNVKPLNSIIEIDGKVEGKTPAIINNIIVGTHSIKVTAVNGNEIKKKVQISENEIASIEEIIPEISGKDFFEKATKASNNGNKKLAIEYYQKAVELGNTAALNALGNCYYHGWGVKQSYSKAVKWYMQAAAQGHTDAQYKLGYCYALGEGVTQSNVEAVKWYMQAANQGHKDAQFSLGNCYFHGWGVSESRSEAVKWYKKSAENGNRHAIETLNNMGVFINW